MAGSWPPDTRPSSASSENTGELVVAPVSVSSASTHTPAPGCASPTGTSMSAESDEKVARVAPRNVQRWPSVVVVMEPLVAPPVTTSDARVRAPVGSPTTTESR